MADPKKTNDVDAYEMGRRAAEKAKPGQLKTTAAGKDPGVPKAGDQVGAYNKGYYDGAVKGYGMPKR